MSQSVQYSYTSSSPSSTSHCPHPESRHLPVPWAVCLVPQWPAVEDVAGHSSDSKQHAITSPLAKVLLLTCWVWSSAAVTDSLAYYYTNRDQLLFPSTATGHIAYQLCQNLHVSISFNKERKIASLPPFQLPTFLLPFTHTSHHSRCLAFHLWPNTLCIITLSHGNICCSMHTVLHCQDNATNNTVGTNLGKDTIFSM